ncbi:protein O-GlcNAcase isoform X2 [Folsomia candida]|uniref:protein O-GlcNAcase isoform X2 n=1 Tax=Folsomia candida TaxID=158441 RepID=UPI000B8FD86A|nr:protein O-GlcNAcase isoform X2 [Folsomia candida]
MESASSPSSSSTTATKEGGKKSFMCGVVEGFYGRPWTTEQRKDLFIKMRKWGMDSYLYAPKDDYKHRFYWREQYTVEEADHLGSLISAAKDNDITFIYAISPGLDIVYSSAKDIAVLKRKLEQVTQLGCTAFAILFDDIDIEMTKADKEMFKSFAHAQVSVTNEAFQHVNPDTFLFCPTQYCATRAVPNVAGSEYLNTIGTKLDLQIDIMWTGPKVISKDITLESIDEITEVLRRPPVIWDNLHANDYDQKRLFLGPYAGRSPHLIPRLRGVLTNPNCEYGANFVAIHTLAQWRFCTEDARKKMESLNYDAKLETENDEALDRSLVPEKMDANVYHPYNALKVAIKEWLKEFNKGRNVWGPIVKPQIVSVPIPLIPSMNTCIAVTPTTMSSPIQSTSHPSLIPSLVPSVPTVNCSALDLTAMLENRSEQLIPSTSTTMMNSLVADDKILRADSGEAVAPVTVDTDLHPHTAPSSESDMTELPLNKDSSNKSSSSDIELESIPPANSLISHGGLEPMDTATPPIPSSPRGEEDAASSEREDVAMAEGSDRASTMSSPDEGVESGPTSVSVMNLDTELELNFISPTSTNHTMQVENSHSHATSTVITSPSLPVPLLVPSHLDELTAEDLHLLCDLFYLPYEHGTQGLQIMHEFQWLKTNSNVIAGAIAKEKMKPEGAEWYQRAAKFDDLNRKVNTLATKLNDITNRELLYEIYPYIWDIRGVISLLNSYVKWLGFSKGWREAFMSGDQEPWVIRGGLTAELQRLIPVDRGTDLFMYKAPVVPSSQVYTIRPYRPSDEPAVYKVCLMTFKDGLSAVEEFSDHPKLAGDIKIGGYLTLNPDINFVVEDESETVVGSAVAVLDARDFRRKLDMSWMDVLRKMYPVPTSGGDESPFVKDVLSSLQVSDMKHVPDDVRSSYPSELRFHIVSPLADPSVPKRLMTCVLAALRANGVFGCFVETSCHEKHNREFFRKLGFAEIDESFMGRAF